MGQILHYATGQQFTEHHDYFDPATDPPENYEKGGNRLLTVIIYLSVCGLVFDCTTRLASRSQSNLLSILAQAAEEGGETEFQEINRKIVVEKGSAVMFYNLKHGCDGVNPSCVDEKTRHAGLMPKKGEKWVATKVYSCGLNSCGKVAFLLHPCWLDCIPVACFNVIPHAALLVPPCC